jgi:putative transposase
VPKLRRQAFETAIVKRYRRRETSVEEALIKMYLAGVSVRRVEDITEALWGTRVSPGTVSRLNQKIYAQITAWRNRPIEGTHPYVYLDGIVLKRSWAGEVRNVSLLVAIGVSAEGFREIMSRSALHRLFQRHGISRLPEVAGEPKKRFPSYPTSHPNPREGYGV